MAYLYHVVPPNMTGTTLYPLNMLKDIHPEIFQVQAKKYEGRKRDDMAERIPSFDCLWNDVLFLTAAHPTEVKQALREAGHPANFRLIAFQFDSVVFNPALLAVYIHRRG